MWQHCAQEVLFKMNHRRPWIVYNWKRVIHVASSDAMLLLENVISGNIKAALLLVKDKAVDVNAADSKGWTPLIHASKCGHYDLVQALVQERNVDLGRQTKTGHTAMEISMFYQQHTIYELLRKAESTNSKSHPSDQPLMFRREAVHRSSKEWLEQAITSSSSVFIALRRNYPLCISTEGESSVQLMKLNYSMVKPFLTEDNIIYLGVVDKHLQSKTILTNHSFETNSTVIGSSSDTGILQECSKLQLNSNEVPYFCVDLSNYTEEEVLKLSEECAQAELLHPYRILTLGRADVLLYSQAWPLVDWHQRYCRCPTCGSATKTADGGYKRLCQNQGCKSRKGVHNTSYPRVDPTAICAVTSRASDRCILANKTGFPTGMFSCVAGFIEPGETIEEACVREVKEELAIDIDPETLRYIGSQPWPGPSVLMVGYISQVLDDLQNIDIDTKELKSARWFQRSEVVDMLVHQHREKFFVPPKEAIAHRLLKTWVLETAFK